MKYLLLIPCAIGLLTSCNSGTKDKSSATPSKEITLKLEPKSGSNVSGDAKFTEKDGQVTFTANITGLKPGIHAIHIHEKADCSDPKGASAGGHWNPTFKKHGKWGSGEYHKGDIGNFAADENGNGTVTLTTSEWCISCNDETKNIVGKGLIVHEKADDYVTQPTGDAGGRVACAGIIK
ncbi:superoxide dismutase family protein [Flavobacterium silvaticum]|uniref:Superoxide dismutase [Cu-Zn] n=1 Tax=Flavobacterium silvaticum TaxID=1852020 RepID=A0A972FYU8_9FLAO|nr:superoxide dismutase family protein [Flavobacterium silvaticum]NMH27336.1 superoxide dismutase family protein [Flavobacterium silvaticum]